MIEVFIMNLVNEFEDFEEHDKITLEIKDVGPIDNAKLNINKINIVGGLILLANQLQVNYYIHF